MKIITLLSFVFYPLFFYVCGGDFNPIRPYYVQMSLTCIVAILSIVLIHSFFRYVLGFIFAFIISAQFVHILVTGNYIVPLSFSNASEISSVPFYLIIQAIVIFILICGYSCWHLFYLAKHNSVRKTISLISLCIFLGLLCMKNNPIHAFFRTLSDYYDEVHWSVNESTIKKQKEIYGKQIIYHNNKTVPDLHNKNIIVLFAEGFSYDTLSSVSKYDNLTPNLDAFINSSLSFENYYNHTAATFRGIRGTLSSSYQKMGGVSLYNDKKGIADMNGVEIAEQFKDTVIDLPHILKKHNYNTYFLSAHSSEYNLNKMLQQMDFDKVFGADDYQKNVSLLTDQQIFSYLSNLIETKKLQEPYFIAVYNIGTHLGQDSPDVKYQFNGKNDNIILNSLHNYDDAFGKFIRKVRKEKNVTVILTADHAAYPSPLYNETFHKQRQYFVDKIPFAIWSLGISPKKINVNGRNSLDFAPTLLNMMNINNEFNYFLGCSLFDKNCALNFDHITAIGSAFFTTKNSSINVLGVSRESSDNPVIQKIIDSYSLSGKE